MAKMMTSPKMKKAIDGFSLLELLTAIVVFGIICAVAIPGFLRWLPDYYLKSAARDLMSNFQLAKITAVKSGVNCTISFNQAVDGKTWDYVIFRDADNDLEWDGAATEDIIKQVEWTGYHPDLSMKNNSFAKNDDGLNAAAFRSNGIPRNNTGGFGGGTVTIKNNKGSEIDVVMSPAGSVRLDITIK